MAILAGIDLGTTYSALAVLNEIGEPVIVPNRDGKNITPSAVAFNSDGTIVVGDEAKNRLSEDPENVVQFVKRKMAEPNYRYNIGGKSFSPVDISSLILKKLKKECSEERGEIRDVVITVPAAFSDVERKSTIAAAEIAGLNVLDTINEPTAAAIFYGKQTEVNGTILVYDLGGGTFDVTILKINGSNSIRVLTSKGDVHLGGVDFDHAIVKIINDREKSKGEPLFKDEFIDSWNENSLNAKEREFFYNLMKKAELAKKTLSSRPVATINSSTPSGKNLSCEITRSDFEEAISNYIAQTEMLIDNALEDAKLNRSQIDKILFVGGSTRVPCVQKSIERIFRKSPERAVNVDEAVALGAAIYSAMSKIEKSGPSSVPAVVRQQLPRKVIDVCNMNFGVITLIPNMKDAFQRSGKEFKNMTDIEKRRYFQNVTILKKNTVLPCKNSERLYTAFDNQTRFSLLITECLEERKDPSIVTPIDTLEVRLSRAVPVDTPIDITYSYDKSQCLHIFVECDGVSAEQEINYSEALSSRQKKKKMREIEDFEIVDE